MVELVFECTLGLLASNQTCCDDGWKPPFRNSPGVTEGANTRRRYWTTWAVCATPLAPLTIRWPNEEPCWTRQTSWTSCRYRTCSPGTRRTSKISGPEPDSQCPAHSRGGLPARRPKVIPVSYTHLR